MAGANYMGGKRNAANSRAKDKTNRAQKRFFGQQRLNLASKKPTEEDNVSQPPKTRHISEFTFAHAQKRIHETTEQHTFVPEPIHVAPYTPTSKDRLKKICGQHISPVSSSTTSRVLEAIDTTEPISLRAAMDKILALSDLAGLSRLNVPSMRPKRGRSPSESSPVPKKYYASSPLPPSSAPRTSSSSSRLVDDDTRHFNVSSYSSFHNSRSGSVDHDYSDGIFPSEAIEMVNRNRNSSPRYQNVYPSPLEQAKSSPQTQHWVSLGITPLTNDQPDCYSHRILRKPLSPSARNNSVTRGRFSFSGNVFDYEDPWKVVGLVLGVEKSPHAPKTRNFSAMLEQIPSPSSESERLSAGSLQQYERDSLFSEYPTQGEGIICDDEQHNHLHSFIADSHTMDETQSSQTRLNSLFSCYSDLDDTETYSEGELNASDSFGLLPALSIAETDNKYDDHGAGTEGHRAQNHSKPCKALDSRPRSTQYNNHSSTSPLMAVVDMQNSQSLYSSNLTSELTTRTPDRFDKISFHSAQNKYPESHRLREVASTNTFDFDCERLLSYDTPSRLSSFAAKSSSREHKITPTFDVSCQFLPSSLLNHRPFDIATPAAVPAQRHSGSSGDLLCDLHASPLAKESRSPPRYPTPPAPLALPNNGTEVPGGDVPQEPRDPEVCETEDEHASMPSRYPFFARQELTHWQGPTLFDDGEDIESD
ncbi:hypothetical protein E1B28_011377 [Marasmius oreades]|uniref:Uncharacterized protein n=1 Tax=Marasmius oreades TaxID=181124 RepID=A0A9P7RUK7_9AGAR|nr:uncharacterized protein E1B28_011377 [Marasmius oreades]KAG7089722.1 hypothetical protein E1B28_011377 [Marasmius oreades]